MARSPLTLAASVTAALPGVGVVGVSPLTENGAGRFDSAVARLDDGRQVVVRTPVDEEAAADLAAESRALRALTPGVRALLPFRAPEVLGEAGSGMARVLVVDLLEGYRVDPAHLPKGPGISPAIGEALAAVHGLPPLIVRTDGLPLRTPEQVRDDVERLLDRAESTRRIPDGLLERWRRALAVDALWRFESAVVLGGATSSSVLLADDDTGAVVGLLDWNGLSVGDPATDLRWLASAPAAADDVYAGYVSGASRAPDALLRERARLYAELEFAKWLVHGHDRGRSDVVDDAVALLEALADGVRGDDIVPDAGFGIDVDAALASATRVPETAATPVDTSMQTDAYDPEMVSLFLSAERDRAAAEEAPDFGLDGLRQPVDQPTAPIDMTGWADADPARGGSASRRSAPAETQTEAEGSVAEPDEDDLRDEAERASRAALRRWGATGGDGARVGHGA
jgi:aminoglycoside phosphotransferase (APT) family kinase protein